jgi:NAD(P)-dependent dehydrogenase (short-subunit alcohol dehydrogenase family)
MEFGLRGKTAFVTGASQGIGREIARSLHNEGVVVTLVGQTRTRLDQAVQELRGTGEGAALHAITADLTLLAEVERVAAESLQKMGQIDILVNCAGQAKQGSFFSMSDEDFNNVWQVKAIGSVRLVRAIAPHMIARNYGRIVNIVGTAARTPTPDFIAVGMANAALVNFTRGISRELAHHNVRINSISPGWTLTERLLRSLEMKANAEHIELSVALQLDARGIPTGHHVEMSEIANMTLLALSDLCPSLTGEDIIIDGGATPSI